MEHPHPYRPVTALQQAHLEIGAKPRMNQPTTLLCLVCQRREYDRPWVCESDRDSIPRTLTNIGTSWAVLDPTTKRKAPNGIRVTGSAEAPIPLYVDAHDLQAPPNHRPLSEVARAHLQDQIGHTSVAHRLDQWARDFATYRHETLPMPTVMSLIRWLSDRTEWACDHHPAIADYVSELRELEATLRGVAGTDHDDTHPVGPCPLRCGGTLKANPWQDSAECPKCGHRWAREQWGTLTRRKPA